MVNEDAFHQFKTEDGTLYRVRDSLYRTVKTNAAVVDKLTEEEWVEIDRKERKHFGDRKWEDKEIRLVRTRDRMVSWARDVIKWAGGEIVDSRSMSNSPGR